MFAIAVTAVTFCVRTSCPDVRVPAICSLLPSRGPPDCIMLSVRGIREQGGGCRVRSPWWRARKRVGRGRTQSQRTQLWRTSNGVVLASSARPRRLPASPGALTGAGGAGRAAPRRSRARPARAQEVAAGSRSPREFTTADTTPCMLAAWRELTGSGSLPACCSCPRGSVALPSRDGPASQRLCCAPATWMSTGLGARAYTHQGGWVGGWVRTGS
jgi:hypothetical protein